MEPILIYFIKSGALIVLFLSAYYFFLRKETFFKSNRWFLLFGLVISVLLPVVTFKKTVWVESQPVMGYEYAQTAVPTLEVMPTSTANNVVATVIEQPPTEIDWFWVAVAVYGIGILALLVKFALDYFALKRVLKGKHIYQQEDYKFVNVQDNIAPFSYFNYIVYNPELYSANEMENILEHEKVHCSQNHTIDVLIARVFCIAFWWNPFVWFYKKAIVQNLEFIADSDASKNISDKKAYQFTLLKITTHESCVAISNHFFQSLIKKRIVMLNKNQSKRWNSWKYAIIVPLLAVFMWQFQVKVVAQEKASNVIEHSTSNTIKKVVTAKSTDAELEELEKLFKEQHDATLKFSKVKRNKQGEIISLKATMTTKGTKGGNKSEYNVAGTDAISSFTIIKYNDSKGKELIAFGEGSTTETVFGKPNGKDSIHFGKVVEEVEIDDVAYATHYSNNTDLIPPTPPTPPMPPAVPNYPMPPSSPNFPTPPTPPTTPPTESNKKAWKKFEEEMKNFESKMTSAEMKKWEKEIEEYGKKMDAMNPDTAAFDKEMQAFDKEMQAFDKEMKVFEKEMQEFGRQIQEEVREDMKTEREEMQKDREEARKDREKARAEAQKLREKAKKERDAASKNRK